MRLRSIPGRGKITEWSLQVVGHTIGMTGLNEVGRVRKGPGARWQGNVTFASMVHDEAIEFRGFLHSLRGRAGSFWLRMPRGESELILAPPSNFFADETSFADGTGFALDKTGDAALSGNVAKGATTLTLNSTTTGLGVGDAFWIGARDETGQLLRAHTVSGASVTFYPPLRRQQLNTSPVFISGVEGLFRLAQDTPAVPFVASKSLPIQIAIEEYY